jgi:hypothetical protein
MNTALRAALTAALALPLALPATANQLIRLDPAQSHQPVSHALMNARQAFERLHAKPHGKKVAHFAYPYAVTLDAAGNVYVANVDSAKVSIIAPDLKVSSAFINTGSGIPVSLAADTYGNIYVGELYGSSGYVGKYNSNLSLVQTITANASEALSIAVDQAQDLYLVTGQGLALDDPYGNSISSNIFSTSSPLYSVSVGGPNVYTFYNGTSAFGNTSVALRGQTLQYIDGPLSSATPLGLSCASNGSACWYSDSTNDALFFASIPGVSNSVGTSYIPTGVAVDQARNRLYVCDPQNNAIHIYNATTLALEKSLT